jgi:hypothetical protein
VVKQLIKRKQRGDRMKMKIFFPVILWIFFITGYSYPALENIKYYRVDKIITVTGEITDIKTEKSYHRSYFTVVYLKEEKSNRVYKIEISPDWYCNLDLVKGQKIRVTGSLNKIGNNDLVMTQFLVFQGKTYHFRDKSGFPLWRGKGRFYKRAGQRRRRRQGGGGKRKY